MDLARQLGFEGTPSWVVGDRVFSGAVGRAQLSDAVAAARKGA
jgi:protein-disulfide isomerase